MVEEIQDQETVENPEETEETVSQETAPETEEETVATEEESAQEKREPTSEDYEKVAEAATKLAAEYKDRLLRSQADFDNFRKRTQKEKTETARYAKEEVVKKLLPVLDNFDLALEHASTENYEAFKKGVELVAKQLKEALEAEGLSDIESDNQTFDPNYHHGVAVDNNPDAEDQQITETFQKGYKFKDRVLRPAMVKVNQK